jgi:hypothetical protein
LSRLSEDITAAIVLLKCAEDKLFSLLPREEFMPHVATIEGSSEGALRMMASGRWAVCQHGREPVEITSGELFRVEVAGMSAGRQIKELKKLQVMAHPLQLRRMGPGRYYSVDG